MSTTANRSGWVVATVAAAVSVALFVHRRLQHQKAVLVVVPTPKPVVEPSMAEMTTQQEEDLWAVSLHQFRMMGTGDDDGEREEPTASAASVNYHRQRRAPVSGISTNIDESKSFVVERSPKSDEDAAFLLGVLRKCPLFRHWEESELLVLVSAMRLTTYHKGECIDGHSFYVILQGHVSAIVDHTVLKVLRRGQYFGESNVMFLSCSTPSLSHRVDDAACVCYVLGSDVYRHVTTGTAVNKRELYEGFLDRLPWLSGLTHGEKLTLADALQPVVYEPGELLIEFGTRGEWMYIILSGEVDVLGRDDHGEVIHVCDFSSGDCVGELEFINSHMTVADVKARRKVKAARLSREHFEITMGPIVDVLKRGALEGKYSYYQGVLAQIA